MEEKLSISKEFIEQSKLVQTGPKKKGGPYSSADKHARRDEVYTLHFDYGYSSRRIAETIKINRKTIDNDIKFLYYQVFRKWNSPDPTTWLLRNLESLEVQKIRIRGDLDNATDATQKMFIERLLLDAEIKRSDLELKICNSVQMIHKRSTEITNKWLEKHNHKARFVTYWDTWNTTEKGYEKIKEIKKYEKPF